MYGMICQSLHRALIDGILRQGHKMLIAGPSKAGKSFLQIELCIAIAEGRKWLGLAAAAQGRVLYVEPGAGQGKHACTDFRDAYTRRLGMAVRRHLA